VDVIPLKNDLMVDTADGLRTVEDVTVTTTATGGGFKNTGGGNGLAIVGGLNDL
jgi:hypothetical protein